MLILLKMNVLELNRLQIYSFLSIYANKFRKICSFTNIFVPLRPKMNNRLTQIWQSASVRNVGKLLTANVFAQALGLLVYPILTRMYSPDDFALLSLFTSITGVAVLLANAEYQYAIVLPKEDSQARSLVHLGGLILLCVVGVLCLSLPFSVPIANLFDAPELARWWWAVPFCVAALGAWNILNYWYIRRKVFSRISGYQITQSIFAASAKIGLGALGWLRGGMIMATTFAPILSLVISVGLAWKKCIRELRTVRFAEIRSVARKYANFPKFNLPRSFVNSVGQSLPIWLLTPQFGLEQVGYFSLAMMAAFVPLNIIARACYQVLFQKISEHVQQRRSIRSVLLQFVAWMGGSMAVGLAVVYIFVPQLVVVLFGDKWIESATLIRYLYPYLVLTPICGSICFLSDVFAKQKIAMWMEAGYVAVVAAVLEIGILSGSFLTSVSLFAWARFAFLAIQLTWFATLVHNYHRSVAK